MRIKSTCPDGSQTLALWPSMALLHWYGRSIPRRPIENPEPFQIYVGNSPVPSDDQKMFLTLVYAEIERRWNKTPPFEIEPPDPKGEYDGGQYQARCLEVLRWLHAEGNITSLEIAEES